ncbi:MAG: ribonuclease HII [Endozoicomonadaceae bacterium]|nr:ribonuclease HII [Endozoicomonadaceae bacterium]
MNSFLINTTQMDKIVAGVDEAGRGPLCGPVVAAAVILNPQIPIEGLNDSKKLTEKKREHLAEIIKRSSLAYSIGEASVEEIDQLNILQASLLAMRRAVEKLSVQPDKVLVDGNHCPPLQIASAEAIIKGDSKVDAIAAASILAKVTRDHGMLLMDKQWPQYGIAKHKGYPTKLHLQALKTHGPAPIHRRSFRPVQILL